MGCGVWRRWCGWWFWGFASRRGYAVTRGRLYGGVLLTVATAGVLLSVVGGRSAGFLLGACGGRRLGGVVV
ncbi:MAG: hypothetical protein GU356_03055 [Pyrobaculum sp.]|nr:hypothetical protein [Pyrobaculum sp.]